MSEQVSVPRMAMLEAELDLARRWKAEALPVIAGLQDLGHALGIPLGTRITGPDAVERARALAVEVSNLRTTTEMDAAYIAAWDAAVAAVRELHRDEWVVIDMVGGFVCAECRAPVESEPCPTVRALSVEVCRG